MDMSDENVRASILRAVDAFNAEGDGEIPAADDTVLLGRGGAVDSMGLVRFVLLVERQLQDDFGAAVSLTDEKAMSQRNSPFRTIRTLAEYASGCLRGNA